jgi:hypothetical protein
MMSSVEDSPAQRPTTTARDTFAGRPWQYSERGRFECRLESLARALHTASNIALAHCDNEAAYGLMMRRSSAGVVRIE